MLWGQFGSAQTNTSCCVVKSAYSRFIAPLKYCSSRYIPSSPMARSPGVACSISPKDAASGVCAFGAAGEGAAVEAGCCPAAQPASRASARPAAASLPRKSRIRLGIIKTPAFPWEIGSRRRLGAAVKNFRRGLAGGGRLTARGPRPAGRCGRRRRAAPGAGGSRPRCRTPARCCPRSRSRPRP